MGCVNVCQVISNCPSFTATTAFCYVAVPVGTGRLLTNNSFNPTTSSPFSMIALEYPQSITSSDDPFFQVNNQSLNLSTTRYRYVNNTANNQFLNIGASGSLSTYLILNNGTNQTSNVMGTSTLGGGSIYLMTVTDTVYIEEAGVWLADVHASFPGYYSQASAYLGGF